MTKKKNGQKNAAELKTRKSNLVTTLQLQLISIENRIIDRNQRLPRSFGHFLLARFPEIKQTAKNLSDF